jgi:hypothetical protein
MKWITLAVGFLGPWPDAVGPLYDKPTPRQGAMLVNSSAWKSILSHVHNRGEVLVTPRTATDDCLCEGFVNLHVMRAAGRSGGDNGEAVGRSGAYLLAARAGK